MPTDRRTEGSSKVDFYFPDSQDQVDPSYDFAREASSLDRVRQRDDRYADDREDRRDDPRFDLALTMLERGLVRFSERLIGAERNEDA